MKRIRSVLQENIKYQIGKIKLLAASKIFRFWNKVMGGARKAWTSFDCWNLFISRDIVKITVLYTNKLICNIREGYWSVFYVVKDKVKINFTALKASGLSCFD